MDISVLLFWSKFKPLRIRKNADGSSHLKVGRLEIKRRSMLNLSLKLKKLMSKLSLMMHQPIYSYFQGDQVFVVFSFSSDWMGPTHNGEVNLY